MYSSSLPLNAPYSCAFEPGMQTIVHPLSNAPSPMAVTLFGMITFLRFAQPLNAFAPMLDTVFVSSADGIVAVASVPVYSVIPLVSSLYL